MIRPETYRQILAKTGDADTPHRYEVLFRANHYDPHPPNVVENLVSPSRMDTSLAAHREAQLRNPTIVDNRFRFPMSPADVGEHLRTLLQQDRRRAAIERAATEHRTPTPKRQDWIGRTMSDLFDPNATFRHGMWWATPEPPRQWS